MGGWPPQCTSSAILPCQGWWVTELDLPDSSLGSFAENLTCSLLLSIIPWFIFLFFADLEGFSEFLYSYGLIQCVIFSSCAESTQAFAISPMSEYSIFTHSRYALEIWGFPGRVPLPRNTSLVIGHIDLRTPSFYVLHHKYNTHFLVFRCNYSIGLLSLPPSQSRQGVTTWFSFRVLPSNTQCSVFDSYFESALAFALTRRPLDMAVDIEYR